MDKSCWLSITLCLNNIDKKYFEFTYSFIFIFEMRWEKLIKENTIKKYILEKRSAVVGMKYISSESWLNKAIGYTINCIPKHTILTNF